MKNNPIPTITCPWWLLQLWLNLYVHKLVTQELGPLKFPSQTYREEDEAQMLDEEKFSRCTSFDEIALAISIDSSISQFFRLFYRGLPEDILTWFPYDECSDLEHPSSFKFDTAIIDNEAKKIMNCLLKPCLLFTEVRSGREKPPISYGFYNPSIAARQMGLGQLPPGLYINWNLGKLWMMGSNITELFNLNSTTQLWTLNLGHVFLFIPQLLPYGGKDGKIIYSGQLYQLFVLGALFVAGPLIRRVIFHWGCVSSFFHAKKSCA